MLEVIKKMYEMPRHNNDVFLVMLLFFFVLANLATVCLLASVR
jgi:hypothetical protein